MDFDDNYIELFMVDGREYQKPYGPEHYRHMLKKQESFDTLLKWVIERKRGKLSYAKRILAGGFNYYSYSQQVKIIKTFLFQSMGDRSFAYKKLYGLWDESFEDVVKRAWNEYHDEKCGWLITRFFPKEFLAENIEALSTPYNYFFLCKRLGQEEWFVPAKEKFRHNITIVEYLEAVSMTKHPIAEDEANELLYRMVSVLIYAHLANNEQKMSEWGRGIEIDDEDVMGYKYKMTMSYWFRCPDLLIYMNDNFKEVLVYLCLMGLRNTVKGFCTWCGSIKAKYSDNVDPLITSNQDGTSKAFLSAIIESFPDDYRYMLDYEDYQTKTWLNRRWRIMLQPQQRTKSGSKIQMPLVSIYNITEVDLTNLPIDAETDAPF